MLDQIFGTAAGISSVVGLLAFSVAAVLVWQLNKARQENKKLELIPEAERGQLIDEYLSRYGLKIGDMSEANKFALITDEMRRRYNGKIVFLLVLAIAAVICFAIAAWSQLQGNDHAGRNLSNQLANLARDKVHLRRKTDGGTENDYLGISKLTLGTDLTSVVVTLEPRGDYESFGNYWTIDEAKAAIAAELNRVKNEQANLRELNIADVAVDNLPGPEIRPGHDEKYVGLAPIRGDGPQAHDAPLVARMYLGDHEAARQIRENEVRYFIDSLTNLQGIGESEASQAILRGIASWQKVLPVFRPVDRQADANAVIMAGSALDGGAPALCDIGPPSKGFLLRLQLSPVKSWTGASLEQAVCHEIGHILGIRHSDVKGQRNLMNVVIADGISTPQDEDIAVARRIWGNPTPPAAVSQPPVSSALIRLLAEKLIQQNKETGTVNADPSLALTQAETEEAVRLLLAQAALDLGPATDPSDYRDDLLVRVKDAIKRTQATQGIAKPDGILGTATLKQLRMAGNLLK